MSRKPQIVNVQALAAYWTGLDTKDQARAVQGLAASFEKELSIGLALTDDGQSITLSVPESEIEGAERLIDPVVLRFPFSELQLNDALDRIERAVADLI